MLRYCFCDSGRLVLREAAKGESPVWIDLLKPTYDEDKRIEALLGISIPTREEMQEIEVSARLYNEDGAEFMTISAVTKIDTDDPILDSGNFCAEGPELSSLSATKKPKPLQTSLPAPRSPMRSRAQPASRSWRA